MHPAGERPELTALAQRLYELRQAAGLTQERMAADLGWPPSKISKIERGHQMPTTEDIEAWSARCGVPPEDTAELLRLLASAQAIRRDARSRAGRSQAAQQVTMDERTRAAARIRDFEPMAIPGLLQTHGYARSIAAQVAALYGAGDVDETATARLERQKILHERDKERTFEFIITEAALRMPPCPIPAMLAQLYHLLDVLNMEGVTLAVIPLNAELAFAPFFGFLMLDDTVIVEDYLGSDETSGDAAAVFEQIFGLLLDQAVTGDEASNLIITVAADLTQRQGGA